MKTRFDFEQEIMNCWSVVDDIDVVRHALLEQDADTDRIDNMLLGLTELYQVKFDIMFKTFESLVSRRELDRGIDGDQSENPDLSRQMAELNAALRTETLYEDQRHDSRYGPAPDVDLDGRC